MLRRPKTLPPAANVGDVREFFRNPQVMTALLSENGDFRGAIGRGQLSDEAADDAPALDYTSADTATISPQATVEEALEKLRGLDSRRLVVLDADGATLLGLVCLKPQARASAGTRERRAA
jgi:CBS domain-containing protein